MLFLTFFVKPQKEDLINKVHESGSLIKIPLIILAGLSFSFIFNLNPFNPEGWIFEGISIYEDKSYHQDSIHLYHEVHKEMKVNHTLVSILSVLFGLIGISMAYYLYIVKPSIVDSMYQKMSRIKLYQISFNKFYFDHIYNRYIYKPFKRLTKKLAYFDWEVYDKKFINFFGFFSIKVSDKAGKADYSFLDQTLIDGFAKLTDYTGKKLQRTQNGVIQNYLLIGIIGIIVLIMIIQQF